jgi:hypothetical protein
MHAHQARVGDVLLDGHGKVWHRTGIEKWRWETFSGPVAYYGPWLTEYGPQGELTLLVRDGRPVPSMAPEGENKPADG